MTTELDTELKSQYQGLSEEVKNYFDNQQKRFLDNSKSKYPSPDTYQSDRKDFLIKKKIDDLDTHRQNVWSYLSSEFERNTNEKNRNAEIMDQNTKELKRKEKELKKLQEEYQQSSGKTNTSNRLREIEKYEYYRRSSQVFIMKVIAVSLLSSIILLFLTKSHFLPLETLYIVLFIFGGMVLYVIYYLYLENPGRSHRYWDKYYFEQPKEQEINKQPEFDEFDYDTYDKKLDKEFNKYLDSCAKKPTPKPIPTNITPST